MTLDSKISLKYWLDDPFWTTISPLDLLLDGPEYRAFFSWPRVVKDSFHWEDGVKELDSLALVNDFSRSEMREDISAIMVFFGRRVRGPEAGYSQGLPARVHAEQGSVLSHRIFLRLQAWHERGIGRLVLEPTSTEAEPAWCARSAPASDTEDKSGIAGCGVVALELMLYCAQP